MEKERQSSDNDEPPNPKKFKPNESSEIRRKANNEQHRRRRMAKETTAQKQIREADRKLRRRLTGSVPNAAKFESSTVNGIEILFASTSQVDELVFMKESRGCQCMTMSLCFLIRCRMIEAWNRRELNATLIYGDELYRELIRRCRLKSVRVSSDGYLYLNHVQVLKGNLELFGQQWELGFNDNEVRLKFEKFDYIN